ncbi:MAG: DUF459 domain-containing protein [Nannocystaceae bacterium]
MGLGRRQWCGGVAAGVAALACPRSARATLRSKVLIVGDSMVATSFGAELESRLSKISALDITRYGRSSSGLARPDFFDWMARAQRLQARINPEVVISMIGGNDAQALYAGPRSWIKWGTSEWETQYTQRLQEFRSLALPGKGTWISVGLPPMRLPKFDAKVEKIDRLRRQTLERRAGGHFIETRALLAPNDEYQERLRVGDRVRRVRTEDGIHLSLHGAKFLADHVEREVVQILSTAGVARF